MIEAAGAGVVEEPLRPGTHYRTEFFREVGLISTTGLVLDVGGRDGRTMSQLGVDNGVLVDVELSPRAAGVAYVQGSGTQLPLAERCADTVIALDVIEHIDDDAAFVAELVRVLKPGGQLVMTTPQIDIRVLPGRAQKLIDRSWGHYRVPGYEAEHLASMLTAAGATDVNVTKVAMRAYRRGYVVMRILWSLPGSLGQRLVRAAAHRDVANLEGPRGFLLATATRP